jgi:hypothetical protein
MAHSKSTSDQHHAPYRCTREGPGDKATGGCIVPSVADEWYMV